MRDTLVPGLTGEFRYVVPATKTVPHLYPESDEFQAMPDVLATGFLVGLLEWACIQVVNPHLDWPTELTVGTHVDVSHEAPTPPGLEVAVQIELVDVDGRRLTFRVSAHDGVELIAQGVHQRSVIDRARFDQRVTAKRP